MSSASTMSAWPFTALPPGTRPDRGSASTMRTIVTAALPETARQRLGPHSLVSDGTAMGYPPPKNLEAGSAEPIHGERQVPRRQIRAGLQINLICTPPTVGSQAALCGPERRLFASASNVDRPRSVAVAGLPRPRWPIGFLAMAAWLGSAACATGGAAGR